jgi:hypothetical protein
MWLFLVVAVTHLFSSFIQLLTTAMKTNYSQTIVQENSIKYT